MHHQPIVTERVFRHCHLACGIGAAAKGFNMANPRVGKVRGCFKCTGALALVLDNLQSAFGLDEFDLSLVRGSDR